MKETVKINLKNSWKIHIKFGYKSVIKKQNTMATITINIEDIEDAPTACREVANLIEEGYTSGIIGCSGDTWEIDEN